MVRAEALFGCGSAALGAGDVIEHQVRLEAEQVAEAMIEGQLDLLLGGHELVEGAILTRQER